MGGANHSYIQNPFETNYGRVAPLGPAFSIFDERASVRPTSLCPCQIPKTVARPTETVNTDSYRDNDSVSPSEERLVWIVGYVQTDFTAKWIIITEPIRCVF